MKFISNLSAICILTGALAVTSGAIAIAGVDPSDVGQQMPSGSKTQTIDSFTDNFFYQANPELNGRKLRASDKAYVREWNMLRRAIVPLVKSSDEACFRGGHDRDGNPYWELDLSLDDGTNAYDYLADVIYYHRNPRMNGQKLRRGTAAAREWSAIRQGLFVSVCGI